MSCDEIFLLDEVEISLLVQEGVPGPPGPPGPPGVGINWRGAWSSGATYALDDAVDNGGSSYICILAHTNHAPPNATYWDVLALAGTGGSIGPAGLTWRGAWSSGTAYVVDDAVDNGGSSYICISAHTNHAPPNATYWDLLAQRGTDGVGGGTGPAGLTWRGAWSSGTAYVVDDAVAESGSSYVCILAHTNHVPPNATYWDVLATGSGMANPMTTDNDIIVGGSAGAPLRMGVGADSTFFGVDANGILGYYPLRSDLAPYADPGLFAFGWINQGGASQTAVFNGILLRSPASSTTVLHILKYDLTVSHHRFTIFFRVSQPLGSAYWCGLCLRESSSGKVSATGIEAVGGNVYAETDYWSSPTAQGGSPGSLHIMPAGTYGLRVEDDGTHRTAYYTSDGAGWIQISQVVPTDYITPDQVGFFIGSGTGAGTFPDSTMLLLSWQEEAI